MNRNFKRGVSGGGEFQGNFRRTSGHPSNFKSRELQGNFRTPIELQAEFQPNFGTPINLRANFGTPINLRGKFQDTH